MAKRIGQLTQTTTLAGGDEFVIEQSGLTKRIAASVVRGGLVNADIDGAAAIAFSKLAALDSANILVGNGSNVATKVAVTGDVTISNAGVTAIGSAKVTPTMLSQPLTLRTAQPTTSGPVIDFETIPSWVKRITVMLNGVSTNGTSNLLIQIGAGSITASGYTSTGNTLNNASITNGASATSGFVMWTSNAATTVSAIMTIATLGSDAWVSSHYGKNATTNAIVGGGDVTLSDTLDRVRITTVNGTDTFDAGSVNIMYEG